MPCAAHLGDQVLHSQALPQAKSGWWQGLLKGALVGAAIVAVSAVAVAVTVGTGGFGAPFAIGAAAVIIGSGLRYAQVGFHEGAQAGSMQGTRAGPMQGTRAGPIKTGSRSVFINGKAAALACLSLVSCQQHGDGKRVAQGSETVWINSHRLARVGDQGKCGFVIGEGSPNVFAGAPPASCHGLTVGSEIPAGLSKWVDRAGVIGGYMELFGGLLMGGPSLLKALTSVRGVLSLGFIGGMGYGGSRLATDYAKSHGWSASNQMLAGDFGGLGASLVGGGMLAGGARVFGGTPVVEPIAGETAPPKLLPAPAEPPVPTAQEQVDALPGHGNARHGSQTTLAEQTTRAQTDIAPDGATARTSRATRFDSPEAQLDAVNQAQARTANRVATGQQGTTIIVNPRGVATLPSDVSVVTGHPGGYGSGVEVIRDPITNQPLPGRPVQLTGQDMNARVVLRYNPANNNFEPVTQFPTNEPVTP